MFETLTQYQIISLALACAMLIFLVYLIFRRLSGGRQLRKVRRVIRKISGDFVEKTTLDLGEDQYAYFDYILLRKEGLIVLEIKDFAGHIFASEQIDQWTQVIGGKSYKFDNPYFELQRKTQLLRDVAGGQSIESWIVFTDNADFPKGRPQHVILLRELRGHFDKSGANEIPEANTAAWRELANYLSAGH